jgi:16S rRNA G527 N7-methylase RsmG
MRKTVQILDELKINYPDLVYPETMVDKLEIYLDILQKWNHKTNLTAVDGYLNLIRKHIGHILHEID